MDSRNTFLLFLLLLSPSTLSPILAHPLASDQSPILEKSTTHPHPEVDTTYTFRFVSKKDMFYVPWKENSTELARLLKCIESNKTNILGNKMPLYVDGYCNSMDSDAKNLATAKIRSNRVKAELIIRSGIKEENFVTYNHAAEGDFVTIRLRVPSGEEVVPDNEDAYPKAEAIILEKQKDTEPGKITGKVCPPEEEHSFSEQSEEGRETKKTAVYRLSLQANLLRWGTLTPDLGIEWRINPSLGISVNGTWTTWTWNNKNRRYALWEISPEVRWYLGRQNTWYIGAMFKAGQFNYKLSGTGEQGDLIGGGITGGYQLRLNKALAFDFNLGLGYLNADYEKYEVINGVRVRRGKVTKNWWGPINAGVTLVWRFF